MSTNETSAMTVGVAGGTGFVGGAIVDELLRRGARVVVLTHDAARARGRVPAAAGIRAADVTRPADLAAALDGIDALVIALAFRNSPIEAPRRGQTFERVDAGGTEALVAAAKSAGGLRHLVYLSGAGAAPNAPRHWFRAKWRAEEAVRGSGIPFTIVRPSWVYGPGDRSLNRFLGFTRWLPFVPQIGSGQQRLAPVFVGDVATLVADSLTDAAAGNQAFEIGGPETLTMDEIVRTALRVSGRRRPILHAPASLMRLATRPLTLLPSPPMTPDAIDFITQAAQVDTRPLLEQMPRRLTPLREGLSTYLAPRG